MPDKHVLPDPTAMSGPQASQFLQLLEVYVDDYLHLVQSTGPDRSAALQQGPTPRHSQRFPPPPSPGTAALIPCPSRSSRQGRGCGK